MYLIWLKHHCLWQKYFSVLMGGMLTEIDVTSWAESSWPSTQPVLHVRIFEILWLLRIIKHLKHLLIYARNMVSKKWLCKFWYIYSNKTAEVNTKFGNIKLKWNRYILGPTQNQTLQLHLATVRTHSLLALWSSEEMSETHLLPNMTVITQPNNFLQVVRLTCGSEHTRHQWTLPIISSILMVQLSTEICGTVESQATWAHQSSSVWIWVVLGRDTNSMIGDAAPQTLIWDIFAINLLQEVGNPSLIFWWIVPGKYVPD